MNRSLRRAAYVLLAVALAACAGNKASQREAIESDMRALHEAATGRIEDPQRAARAHRAIDGLGVELLALEETIANLRFQMRTLNARPDATRAEFDALLDAIDARHRAVRGRVLARHFELTGATTAEEWKDLWRHERDALIAAER